MQSVIVFRKKIRIGRSNTQKINQKSEKKIAVVHLYLKPLGPPPAGLHREYRLKLLKFFNLAWFAAANCYQIQLDVASVCLFFFCPIKVSYAR